MGTAQTLRRFVWLCAMGAALHASVSCESQKLDPNATAVRPRSFESSPELFARDSVDEPLKHEEQSLDEFEPQQPPPPVRPPRAAKAAATSTLANIERWIAEKNAEVEPPPAEPARREPVPATPSVVPAPPAKERPTTPAPPRRAERTLTPATNVALGVGIIGASMGAITASSGDGTPGENVMAVTWAGIGLAGLATAGILYAVDPNPEKGMGIQFMIGPMTGVRGRF